jgi:hypothetical protein
MRPEASKRRALGAPGNRLGGYLSAHLFTPIFHTLFSPADSHRRGRVPQTSRRAESFPRAVWPGVII